MSDQLRTIEGLLTRLASYGELMTDRPADESGHTAEISRLTAAFPFVSNAQDWLAFLAAFGGATFVRTGDSMSAGLFGVSRRASLHVLDGEGDPVDHGCLIFCDADGEIGEDGGGYLAYGFDATGERPWGVYGVREDSSEWYAPAFLDWLVRFVAAVGDYPRPPAT